MAVLMRKHDFINGIPVVLYSYDGRNWSSNLEEIPLLERSAGEVEPESPFWNLPEPDKEEGVDPYERSENL